MDSCHRSSLHMVGGRRRSKHAEPGPLLHGSEAPTLTTTDRKPDRIDQYENEAMILRRLHGIRVPLGMSTRLLDELRSNGLCRACDGASLSADAFVQLFRYAIEQLQARMAKGERHPPMSKQEVDLLCRCVLSCNSLGEAIHCAGQFCTMLLPRAGRLSLELQGATAVFHMDSLRRSRSSAACLVDLTGLFYYLQLFTWLIGRSLKIQSVFLAHPRREDAMPFLGLFDAPARFGRPTYGFSFDAALLARPVIRKSSELASFIEDLPFRLVGAAPSVISLGQQVRGFFEAALAQAQELPTLGWLARSLGVSEISLRRRLAAENTSYQVLRRECLREAAQHCLCNTDWTIGRIAGHLGFGGEAAFRRAFQSWTGQAPSHYRAMHQRR
ncbi:AraC family transcriptional regulator [Pseudomonas chlororaphis]|uniref:AraC family transcriptional regulator n=1 Tax=Pseudomonas chlororaphis TaxID=587753 RepID=UPI00209B8C38|nr:AraC family transcriptional regulator [Pseudomonas chlororaphis]MCO7569198.1 AraC family transcriptional regulator [Pseudomonas chlororaphis]MCO7586957.1 AraC family transcriptional regulator [Pseudomonas chlororaphis]